MKKDCIRVAIIFIVGILIAYVINLVMTYGNLIGSSISNETWLNFCGSYCGGLFAVIIGYLAIVHSNRNNEKAINLQYEILKQQHKDNKLNEYNKCLVSNLELLNVLDSVEVCVAVDYENLSLSKSEIVRKKSLIYANDLRYRFVFEVDFSCSKTDAEKQYDNCWIEARALLSDLLDSQMDLIMRISKNQNEIALISNKKEVLYNLSQIIGIRSNCEDVTLYQSRMVDTEKDIETLVDSVNTYKNDIDKLSDKINRERDLLLLKNKELFDLSYLLMNEKRNLPVEKFK